MFPQLLSLLAVLLLCCTIPLEARVVRVEVSSRADVLNGQQFGEAGAYERIVGRVYFSVAVANLHNRRVVDLDNAENLKDGEVAFSSDFIAVRPNDEKKSNGSMLLEIPNRGRGRIIGLVDGGDWDLSKDLGDVWLLRNGYTIVTLGWQWDATGPNALRLYAPVAKGHGKTLKGLLRGDLMPWQPMQEIPLGHLILGMIGGAEYSVAAPDDSRNALSVRDSPTAKRAFVPRSQWQFAHMVDGKLQPSDRHIYLKRGFQAGKIYEYVYVVESPGSASPRFAILLPTPSIALTRSLPLSASTVKESPKTAVSFAIFSIRGSMQMRREGPHSMVCSPMLLARDAAALITGSRNLLATHNQRLRFSFPLTCFRSPICPRSTR